MPFTNRPAFLENCKPIPGVSDHQTAILADIYCHPKRQQPVKRNIYLCNRANMNKPKQDVSQASEIFFAEESIDTPINELWLKFKNILATAIESNVPSKMLSGRFSKRWFDRSCKRITRKKKRVYKLYNRTKRDSDWKNIKRQLNSAGRHIKTLMTTFLKGALFLIRKTTQRNSLAL